MSTLNLPLHEINMNQLIKIIAALILSSIAVATIGFTYLQIQRSQALDESLVSDLTTQLNTIIINQAIQKIDPKPE